MDWELVFEGKTHYFWRKLVTSEEIWELTKTNNNGGYIYTSTNEKVKPSITSGGYYSLDYIKRIKGEMS